MYDYGNREKLEKVKALTVCKKSLNRRQAVAYVAPHIVSDFAARISEAGT